MKEWGGVMEWKTTARERHCCAKGRDTAETKGGGGNFNTTFKYLILNPTSGQKQCKVNKTINIQLWFDIPKHYVFNYAEQGCAPNRSQILLIDYITAEEQ